MSTIGDTKLRSEEQLSPRTAWARKPPKASGARRRAGTSPRPYGLLLGSGVYPAKIASLNASWYERLCEKRPFAFKHRKEKWLYRPKETPFHTASERLPGNFPFLNEIRFQQMSKR